MPAAHVLLVERKSPDEFLITWWDFTGRCVEELANRAQLSRRCDVLTLPESGSTIPKMGTPGCATREGAGGN